MAVALRGDGDRLLAVVLVGAAVDRKPMRPAFCPAVPATKLMTLQTVLTPAVILLFGVDVPHVCLLYTSPSPRDLSTSRMPSSA